MGDLESGLKWWMRYVIVPLIGGGGLVAIFVSVREHSSMAVTMPGTQAPLVKPDVAPAVSPAAKSAPVPKKQAVKSAGQERPAPPLIATNPCPKEFVVYKCDCSALCVAPQAQGSLTGVPSSCTRVDDAQEFQWRKVPSFYECGKAVGYGRVPGYPYVRIGTILKLDDRDADRAFNEVKPRPGEWSAWDRGRAAGLEEVFKDLNSD
jgi:hypothetical protein